MHWQEALIQWARCLLVSWTDGCLVSGEGWWEKPKSPNPVVHLPIQTHDPSWPMTSSFIQNRILWAEKEPYKHNLSHAEPHMQMTMCAHTHWWYITLLNYLHFLKRLNLALVLERLDHVWKIMWHINNIHALCHRQVFGQNVNRLWIPMYSLVWL